MYHGNVRDGAFGNARRAIPRDEPFVGLHFMPDALDRQKTREDDSLTDENWPLG